MYLRVEQSASNGKLRNYCQHSFIDSSSDSENHKDDITQCTGVVVICINVGVVCILLLSMYIIPYIEFTFSVYCYTALSLLFLNFTLLFLITN